MKLFLFLSLLLLPAAEVFADEVEYTCEGDYNKGAEYYDADNSSVAIHAKLHVVMLGDPGGDNGDEYPVVRAELTMKATNHDNLDAGSFRVRNKFAKQYSGRVERYKGHVRLLMGKGEPPAYSRFESTPSFYVFLPWSEENGSDGYAWVQRSNTGQEALPSIRLKCQD
jgi:hypothetical protein